MPEPEKLPSSIGRYEVKRLLGGGAMGNVWLAEDPRIKRKVAVKTMRMDNLRNDADRHECLARFQREAEVSGLLNHPSIVTIYDVGESELGPFLAMEYIQGKPLDALIKSGESMPLAEKLRIIAGIAEALDHAHSHNVVHRDVKPGNVMIAEDGRAKLMDFGIAKHEDATLTQTGTFLGTPSYASPEQIREGKVDNRSDIFSFGVMTFEVLSGYAPFPGSSINTILYRIVNEPPVEVEPPVMGLMPDGWKRVFNKVLAKLPQDRYPSCAMFVRDLMEVTTEIAKDERRELLGILHVPSGEPIVPPILSKSHDETYLVPPRQTHKGRPALMIAAAAFLALGGGGAYLFMKGRGGESLQVSTNPDKAQVFIDGKPQDGLSPLMVVLRPGAHLKVERKGFVPLELDFAPGQFPPVLNLQPLVTDVKVESTPTGATVNFDGQMLKETTPATLRWDQSRLHKLTLTVDGGLGFARDFEVGETPEGKILALVPSGGKPELLDARAEGFLKVAGPFAVRVRVDGKDLGELSASGRHTLPPGKYKVELLAPKVFFRETRTVTIQPGQPASLSLPALAKLTVYSYPGTALVTIDGQATGVESDGNTPIPVAVGSHTIGFEGKGTKQNVEVRGDQTVKIKL
jgi:serine/threonine-protein kinase